MAFVSAYSLVSRSGVVEGGRSFSGERGRKSLVGAGGGEEEGGSLPGGGDVGIDGWVDMMCVMFVTWLGDSWGARCALAQI